MSLIDVSPQQLMTVKYKKHLTFKKKYPHKHDEMSNTKVTFSEMRVISSISDRMSGDGNNKQYFLEKPLAESSQTIIYQSGKRCGIIFVSYHNPSEKLSWRGSRESCKHNSGENYRFLVVRGKDSGIWSLPKGRMSSDTESEEECAHREVREETGIIVDISLIKKLGRIVLGRNVYFILHCDHQTLRDFIIHDIHEVEEVCWKTLDELRSVTCNKDLRALLRWPEHKQGFHYFIFERGDTVAINGNISIYKDNRYGDSESKTEEITPSPTERAFTPIDDKVNNM